MRNRSLELCMAEDVDISMAIWPQRQPGPMFPVKGETRGGEGRGSGEEGNMCYSCASGLNDSTSWKATDGSVLLQQTGRLTHPLQPQIINKSHVHKTPTNAFVKSNASLHHSDDAGFCKTLNIMNDAKKRWDECKIEQQKGRFERGGKGKKIELNTEVMPGSVSGRDTQHNTDVFWQHASPKCAN